MKAFEIFAGYSLTYRPVAVFILITPGQLTAFCHPADNQYQDKPVRLWTGLVWSDISHDSQTTADKCSPLQSQTKNRLLENFYCEVSPLLSQFIFLRVSSVYLGLVLSDLSQSCGNCKNQANHCSQRGHITAWEIFRRVSSLSPPEGSAETWSYFYYLNSQRSSNSSNSSSVVTSDRAC